MAILFNPFGSTDTPSTPTNTYQASAGAKKASTPSPVVAKADPEPFVWENKKETVASTGILKDLNRKSTAKKVAKTEKSSVGTVGLGSSRSSSASTTSKTTAQPKQQTVSKTGSSFGGKAVSTADDDLNSFFGNTKPKTKKVVKTPKETTKRVVKAVRPEPVVRVASKPTTDSAKSAESSSSWSTQKGKTSPKLDDEMFSFSPRTADEIDDAPMLDPAKSNNFDMPKIEQANPNKVSKTQSSGQEISGSLQTVLTKPANSTPAVKEFKIKNPLQTRLSVTFLANGKKVTLKPGQLFQIRQTENVKVKFSRGGSFGFSEKSLSEGAYEFSVTRKDGWKLAN